MSDVIIKETFAQIVENLSEGSFSNGIKRWLERIQMPIDMVTGWEISTDITDITEEGDEWRRKIGGPYNRIKLSFQDGSIKYGKSFIHKEWDIQDDKKENWGYEWVRQKIQVSNET